MSGKRVHTMVLTSGIPNQSHDEFATLYQAHVHAVFNYCFFRVGNRGVAEDLAADAFERAWRARERYRPESGDFVTWLFGIVRHVVIDWQRRHARQPLVELTDRLSDRAPLPDAQVEAAEQRTHLQRLIQTLAPHEQELVALKFGAGMTNRQIARTIQKSEAAVAAAVYRTMQKLRAQWPATQIGDEI